MNAHTAELGPAQSYLQRMWELRHFLMSLVKIDLQSRYRGSFLGLGWSLVRPLGMCIVLCVVFSKIFNVDPAQYAPMLLIGLTFWQFVTESMLTGCETFKTGRAYIRQVPLPLAVFPLRTVLVAGFHASIALALAVVLNAFFNGPHVLAGIVWLIPSVALLTLSAMFVATLCGLAHTHFPDTSHILQIGTQILFYLTPIIYPPEVLADRGRLSQLFELNPLTYYLESIRRPISTGEMPSLQVYGMCILFTILLGMLAGWTLKRLERTLVYWI